MKKSIIITVFVSLIALCGFSQSVSVNIAQNVAKNFYFEHGIGHDSTLKYSTLQLSYIKTEKVGNDSIYYVFNVNGNKGWIIVSAQQNVVPVLAYSLGGIFDTVKANQPPAFKYWLNNYTAQIRYAINQNLNADASINTMWSYYNSNNVSKNNPKPLSIGPLLQTTWAQCGYYNDLCPVDASSVCGDNRVPVGCVATAMAQVMKYWNYPASGTGSHSTSTNYGTLAAFFSSTTYNYANMPNNVTSSNSDVATLMYHCGISVDMDYGPDGSGAYTEDAKNAFLWYFKYDLSAYYRNKDDDGYSDAAWSSLITTNLNNGFPVIMGGQDNSSGEGHEWVCDGYSTANYFHMNWGWGWSGGGNYCYINAIIPNSTPPQPNYTSGQDAIFSLAPPCGTTLDAANTTGTYEDRCTIYLAPGFSTQSGGTFHARIVP
mgnify:CR=1 FL=1